MYRSILGGLTALLLFVSAAAADVKPGDSITPENADKVKDVISPGTFWAVTKGMHINVVAPQRVDWPPPYKEATEKYSGQVRLSPDHTTLVGYVAGQPFPLLDPNDPDVGQKIMWNTYFPPITSDDYDLRFYDCEVQYFNPGKPQRKLLYAQIGHLAGYINMGRTEVEPMPMDPDLKASGVWKREAAYPVIAPTEGRGNGGLEIRYWNPNKADDTWAYISATRRVRRVSEVILSSSTGLSTWDADHVGGFRAKPQEYKFKFLGEKQMLAVANAAHSPEQSCPFDGGATACPENWEMRHVYMIEVTPRPEKIAGLLQSRTIVYVDGEMWFSPYTDSYDQKGNLWKTQIYLLAYRDRPVPDAKVAIYPFKREFVVGASSYDIQSGISTACYLPGRDTPERECWYINMGAVNRDFFTVESMVKAGH
jgi:hypothetical protein